MGLSSDLITQFIKSTRDNTKKTNEESMYGVVSEQNGEMYVKLDGSDVYTPVASTVKIKDGDRVVVRIKNHSATVTGNITNQSAGSEEVGVLEGNVGTLLEVDELFARYLNVELAKIEELVAGGITVDTLYAKAAEIDELYAKKAEIDELIAERIEAAFIDADFITADEITALEARITDLLATYATIERLEAERAEIDELFVTKADIESLSADFANIDFANITELAVENFLAMSGIIEDLVVSEGRVTGTLTAVDINADYINTGTLRAERLVLLGEDGLFHEINVASSGITEGEVVDEDNGIHGRVIVTQSLTANHIAVDDLVAFDATIGGFNLTSSSIYSGVKNTSLNSTRGIYLDTDGQVNIGDESNFIRYIQNEDGTYSLAISADTITYALNGAQRDITDIAALTEYVVIGTYEGEPCILLGDNNPENNSDFRLIITNTRILFQEGTNTPAYITNQSLHIKKAIIEEEMAFGQFVWQIRENGNMGLVWKDELVEEVTE